MKAMYQSWYSLQVRFIGNITALNGNIGKEKRMKNNDAFIHLWKAKTIKQIR